MRKIAKIFGFNSSQHSLRTEVFAGTSTFIVMAYILALAPKAFEGVGGTADPFPTAALFTATALLSAVSTFLMAVYAKRPLAVAPGVGLLFFISGTVCMQMGYSWHFALTAILLEGVLFTALAFSRLRYLIMESIPLSLRSATAVGVGLFLASLGLKSAGMTDSGAAIVSLASIVTEPEKQLFAICVMLSGVLIVYRVKGAIFLSIIVSTILGIPLGLTRFDEVMTIPESPAPLFMQMEWSEDIFSIDMFVCVVSIFFLDVFDTIGTVSGVLSNTSLSRSNGRISRMSHIFQVDAISSMLSGLMGTTTCTSYLESAAGVAEGGRTGVTHLFGDSDMLPLCPLLFTPFPGHSARGYRCHSLGGQFPHVCSHQTHQPYQSCGGHPLGAGHPGDGNYRKHQRWHCRGCDNLCCAQFHG